LHSFVSSASCSPFPCSRAVISVNVYGPSPSR
jgi:hypothetical protein